ncbi:MAG: transporter [Rhodospirillaceae bacterium]|nr:MAG: transporter [Rhodospirillaceae bacterium]
MIQKTYWLLAFLFLLSAQHANAETLKQAWDIALTVDHSLKAAKENTAGALQQNEAAKAGIYPKLMLNSGFTALDSIPATQSGGTVKPTGDQNSFSHKLTISQSLYTSGRYSSNVDATAASAAASKAEEATNTQALKLRVADAYVAVLRANQGLLVAKSHVSSLNAHAADVENKYEQSMVARNDLLSAQVALADARQQEIQSQNALDLARATYNRLLNRPLDNKVSLEDLSPDIETAPLPLLTKKALKQRSELETLMNQISALRHQADVVRGLTGPQVSLSGGYDFQKNKYVVHEGQWFATLGLQWNIFDGTVNKHQASAVVRQAAAVQANLDDRVSMIRLEVRQAWLDVQETQKRTQVTSEIIAQAEENLKMNRDRYESGLSTNTEVLDAETLRTQSLNNHANALYDAVLAALRLKRSMEEL